MRLTVSVDVRRIGVRGLAEAMRKSTASGPLRNGLRQAGAIYLGAMRQRYVRAARGDGTWQPLAASTIAGRRKGKGSGSPEILRDTGLLLNSLTLGGRGSIAKDEPSRILVGTAIPYGKHHQRPTTPGRPPKRAFLVPPDERTRLAMRDVLQRAVNETVKQFKR